MVGGIFIACAEMIAHLGTSGSLTPSSTPSLPSSSAQVGKSESRRSKSEVESRPLVAHNHGVPLRGKKFKRSRNLDDVARNYGAHDDLSWHGTPLNPCAFDEALWDGVPI
jgi:hypothetical protein